MYQILLVSTGDVVGEAHESPREAQAEACKVVTEELRKTGPGRRVLGFCKNIVTWPIARTYVVIQEMVGVWIDTQHGRILPEEDDDNPILFRVGKKHDPRLGTYSEGQFCELWTTDRFEPEQVTAFLIIPDNDAR